MKTHVALIVFLCISLSAFSIIADFTNDYKVDLRDFSRFSQAWQTQQGDPNYNSIYDISLPADQVIDVNDLLCFMENWLEGMIVLDIYNNGWGHYCETIMLPEEGTSTIEFTDPDLKGPYGDNPTHYAYASRDGYYTAICDVNTIQISSPPDSNGYQYEAVVDVDLDPIDPDLFNGTIFLRSSFFADGELSNTEVSIYPTEILHPYPYGLITQFTTDEQGRFAIDLSPGSYWIAFQEQPSDPTTFHHHEIMVSGDYQDFSFPYTYQAAKPNIYIYPEMTTELAVELNFPAGGLVVESEPLYQDGWQVMVEPSGLIDGQYGYLFYESEQPDYGQYETGWIVELTELEAFFRSNLTLTGFNTQEIEDFVDYWIPLLDYSPYYAIYPQYNEQLEEMIQLDFSVQPDNLIRLIYSIRGLESGKLVLPEPEIPAFCRDGFTVSEWGVILK